MTHDHELVIDDTLSISRSELQYRASRAGGAGGQHVNKSSTRIELLWDLEHSASLSEEMRARIREQLAARLDGNGMVRIVASNLRSQLQNRVAAEDRLALLVRRALMVPKVRRATKPPRSATERRLTEKKRRGEKKQGRRDGTADD
jgi:ribosome-associated protein